MNRGFQSFESDTRGVSVLVVLILAVAVVVVGFASVAAIAIDVTALEGTPAEVSGTVTDVTVDDKDTNTGVEMEFNVSLIPGTADRLEVYQRTESDGETMVEKRGVLEEESSVVVIVGEEDYARTSHRVVAYDDGEIVGEGRITVQHVSAEKSVRQAYKSLVKD